MSFGTFSYPKVARKQRGSRHIVRVVFQSTVSAVISDWATAQKYLLEGWFPNIIFFTFLPPWRMLMLRHPCAKQCIVIQCCGCAPFYLCVAIALNAVDGRWVWPGCCRWCSVLPAYKFGDRPAHRSYNSCKRESFAIISPNLDSYSYAET